MNDDKPRLSEFTDYSDLTIQSFSTETLSVDLTSIDYDELELRGAVENGTLRALATRFRRCAGGVESLDGRTKAEADVYRKCAEEIEELIDDE